MRFRFFLFVLLIIGITLPPAAQASFTNLGFEGGSAGWSFFNPGGGGAGNNIRRDDGFNNWFGDDTIPIYPAPEGIYYLELHPGGPGQLEVASQAATFSASDSLQVIAVAAFDSRDYRRDAAGNPSLTGIYGNDRAKVELYQGLWTAQDIASGAAGSPFVTPWERSVWNDGTQVGLDYLAVGGDGSSPPPAPDDPWTVWSYTLPSSGDWTLAYSITSGLHPSGDEGTITQSHALFDVVPEAQPTTLLALGLGLFLLAGYVRRRYISC